MRNTRLEINTNTFINNINKIKDYSKGKIIMPVIKANGYGTYINKRIDILEMFQIVAVALVDEGILLRKNGYSGEIFVLNQPAINEIDLIEEYDLTIGLSSKEFLDECSNRSIKVHLEIETGMNRTGIMLSDLEDFLNNVNKSNFIIKGVYTHLSSADYDKEYTNKQIETFEKAVNFLKNKNINLKYIHISASNGILNYKIDIANTIRPGIIMYGYEPFIGAKKIIPVEPIAKLITNITYIKNSKKNDKISYSQKYTCPKDMVIATIPIGYADGYRRALSNKAYVLVNNKRCRIVGNICMDSCMIDVSDVNAKVGDEVILFDENNITLDEISNICETINYEILCTINERVPRIFK